MKENLNDNDLMKQFSDCSMDAFNQIFQRYKNKLLNYIVHVFLINNDNAEDIVQQSLIKVYQNKFNYKSTYQFSTWIYTITKNLCLNEIKTNKRIVSFDEINEQNILNNKLSYDDDNLNLNNTVDKSQIVKDEILKLNQTYREVLILRYVDHMSIEEISNSTGKNINTVKSLLKRGLETLKEKITKYTIET